MNKSGDGMRHLRYQARLTFSTKVLSALISYAFAILLARAMTAESFGQVAFFMNAAALLSVVGAMGQQIAMVRFVPPLRAWGDRSDALPDFVGQAYARALTGSALLFVAASALAISGLLPRLQPLHALAGFALIPVIGWVDIQSHLARALQRLPLALVPKEILWRGLSALAILAAALHADWQPLGAGPVLAVLLAVLLLLAILQGAVLERLAGFRPRPRWRPRAIARRDWCETTVPFWVSSVSNIFLANADVMTVALLFGPAEAGIYFAANRLAQILAFFVISQNIVIGPQLASASATGRIADIAAILRGSTRAATVPTLAAGAAILLAAPLLLGLFGPAFGAAVPALQLLVLAAIVNAAGGPADIALNMCGHDRLAMRVSLVNLALSAAALGLGGALGGALGVAAGVLAATVLRKMLYWTALRSATGLRSDVLAPAPAAI